MIPSHRLNMKDKRSLMVWKRKPVRMILNWHFFHPMASRELLVLLLLTGFNHSLISYDFHYVIIVNFRVIQTIKDENCKKNKLKHSKCSSDVTVAHTIFPIQSMFPTWIWSQYKYEVSRHEFTGNLYISISSIFINMLIWFFLFFRFAGLF